MPFATVEELNTELNKIGYKAVPAYSPKNAIALPKRGLHPMDGEFFEIESPSRELIQYLVDKNWTSMCFGYYCRTTSKGFNLQGVAHNDTIKTNWVSVDDEQLAAMASAHGMVWHWEVEPRQNAWFIVPLNAADYYVPLGSYGSWDYAFVEMDGDQLTISYHNGDQLPEYLSSIFQVA
jgi:hypothetical protein